MAVRKNFYNGQTVVPKDLNQLYDYTANCNAEMVSQVFGHGIVEGFEVTVENLRKILVSPGLAYTEKGVRLYSEAVESIIVSAEDPTEGQGESRLANQAEQLIPLGLRLDYTKTGLQKDYDNQDTATVWTPKVALVLGTDITADDLSIAVLTVSSGQVVRIEQNGHRFFNFREQERRIRAFSTTEDNYHTTAGVNADEIMLTSESGTNLNASDIVLTAGNGATFNADTIGLRSEGGTNLNASEIVLTAEGETAINADTLNLNADINVNNRTLQDTIRDMIYPIGTFYTQYPESNGQFSANNEPSILFGGRWSQVHNSGLFFRTAGGLSGESRSNGIQSDTMQRLTGNFASTRRYNSPSGIGSSGVFYSNYLGFVHTPHQNVTRLDNYNTYFDNARQARTSSENRPRNMLIRIWKRTS